MSAKQAEKMKSGIITIRQTKGLMGCTVGQIATVKGLGLKGRGSEKELENTPAVRGMIKKVIHLLEVVSETR